MSILGRISELRKQHEKLSINKLEQECGLTRGSIFNPNPEGKQVGDCTVRAIARATGQSWDATYIGLCLQGLILQFYHQSFTASRIKLNKKIHKNLEVKKRTAEVETGDYNG